MTIQATISQRASTLVFPDVNPAAEAVARLRGRHAAAGDNPARQLVNRDYTGAKNPDLLISRIVELEDTLKTVGIRVCGILSALNNATIEAVCNEDTTITVTLTLPDLPEEC